MRLVPALLLALCAAQLPAAPFFDSNVYGLEGTWNDGKQMTIIWETEPLGKGARFVSVEGEIEESHTVYFDITFPVAPVGAKNIISTASVNWFGMAYHDFTRVVEPIVVDCGGVPCHYEPPATSGNGGDRFYFSNQELLNGVRDIDGKTYSVSLMITPPTFETFSGFAYNSKTTETWRTSYYKTTVYASTSYELDDISTPEPGSFVLAGVGVVVLLGLVRRRRVNTRLASALILALSATSAHAAMFEEYNDYNYVGTWNDGKQFTITMWTDPLAQGVTHETVEGDTIDESYTVNFQVTFPSAPAGAKNVMSFIVWDEEASASIDRTITVEPILADCGGVPCHYEPPYWIGTGTETRYFLQGSSHGTAGETRDVSMMVIPNGIELFTHLAYNSKTTITWGQGHYDVRARAVTLWEMESAVPEPGSFVLAGVGVLVLGVVRKRWGGLSRRV
jgi:hypothetical protein